MHPNEIGLLDTKSIPLGSCPDCKEFVYCRKEVGKYMIDKQKLKDTINEIMVCRCFVFKGQKMRCEKCFLKEELGL